MELGSRIVSIVSVTGITAVFSNPDGGKEFKESVKLIALTDLGELKLMSPDVEGFFSCPDESKNFDRYEFDE